MFTERRACEDALSEHMSANPANAPWNRDVKIQSGSPIAPRIARICTHLSVNMGFAMFRPGSKDVARQILEIFPSEAIWALGCLGAHARETSKEVRAYKAKKPTSLVQADARTYALRPLRGFVHLLESTGAPRAHVERANNWIEQIAATRRHDLSKPLPAEPSGQRQGLRRPHRVGNRVSHGAHVHPGRASRLGRRLGRHDWPPTSSGSCAAGGAWIAKPRRGRRSASTRAGRCMFTRTTTARWYFAGGWSRR